MIKRKIRFEITVNSYWPSRIDNRPSLPVLREDGYIQYRIIEFETDTLENSMLNAEKALKEEMGSTLYHIWYWTWLDLDEVNCV